MSNDKNRDQRLLEASPVVAKARSLAAAGHHAALVEYLEVAALAAYKKWDLEADPEERSALAAFEAQNEEAWASE
jgi:hypothetical protein